MVDDAAVRLLETWIGRRAAPAALAWLAKTRADLSTDSSPSARGLAISIVPRRMGKADLTLSADDYAAAETARPGWVPVDWSVDQAARILLLLDLKQGAQRLSDRLRAIAATSDVGELIAFYRGLPLYPYEPGLTDLAAEGLRTSMRSVFEAIAHHNPFPAEHFSQSAWNHMVLKALFIGSALHPIAGLDGRWNSELARILCDYAHERWAAGRPVPPELWRGVGRFADEAAIGDLFSVLEVGTEVERAAATLALVDSDRPAAAEILAHEADLAAQVRSGHITWAGLQAQR